MFRGSVILTDDHGLWAAYLDLLQAGGSDWPEELVRPLGIDLKDPDLLNRGLGMIEQLVEQAEETALQDKD